MALSVSDEAPLTVTFATVRDTGTVVTDSSFTGVTVSVAFSVVSYALKFDPAETVP